MESPGRQSFLVARPGAKKDPRSMAAGFADAVGLDWYGGAVRNTFLHWLGDDELEHGWQHTRSLSEPPRLKAPATSYVEEAWPSDAEEDNMSTISDDSAEGECYVLVLDTTLAEVPCDKAKSAVARLSDLLAINKMGLPSWGSRKHGRSDCRLCDFHGLRERRSRECVLGKFCNHCHISEDHKLTRIRGRGKRKDTSQSESVGKP